MKVKAMSSDSVLCVPPFHTRSFRSMAEWKGLAFEAKDLRVIATAE